ncbi:STAS/SEC14 domain-containing protein [uncultured Algimonas sp.]|uniref:STAS/SEC14 domain-containing protein n=1 Tax=uncultured Algimonas sp. TaxID=1547920 RepID=UPI002603A8C5|nr:STAS/SEC14 domain-containing protein [uncultured Algimonas sp.]
MNDLNTAHLTAKFEDPIVRMTVNGPISETESTAALEWFKQLGESQDEYQLYLELAKMDFPDLGSIRNSFLSLANIMRGLEDCGKCAVVTDSPFLRSTAKIEGTAIPQMEVDSFGIVELAEAETWLEAA